MILERFSVLLFPGKATAGQPLGPLLSQKYIDLDSFCSEYNELTSIYRDDILFHVEVEVYGDKSFLINLKGPTDTFFLKSLLSFKRFRYVYLEELYEWASLKKGIHAYLKVFSLYLLVRNLYKLIRSRRVKVL